MAQDDRRDDSVPDHSSEMEQAEGSRDTVRDNMDQGGGITNRGRDREMSEQEQLPERGRSKSDAGRTQGGGNLGHGDDPVMPADDSSLNTKI